MKTALVFMVALVLIGSAALASGRRAPDFGSYPATKLTQQVTSGDESRLSSLAGLHMDSTERKYTRWTWWRSTPQTFLDSLFPDAKWYRCLRDYGREHGVDSRVLLNGKLWRLDDMNSMLSDAGFKFDSAGMFAAAKAAVLCATFGVNTELMGKKVFFDEFPPLGVKDTFAFPAVTFLSLKRGEWRHPTHHDLRWGVSIDCLMGGQRKQFFLQFNSRVSREAECLFDELGAVVMYFPPKPIGDERRGQLRGSCDALSWSLDVLGDTWAR